MKYKPAISKPSREQKLQCTSVTFCSPQTNSSSYHPNNNTKQSPYWKSKNHVIYLKRLAFQITDVCRRWSIRLMPTMGHFSIWTIWNVHLMGHCCPIHPLKINKFLSFHGSSRFTTKYKTACQWTLNMSSDSQAQPIFSQPASSKAITIYPPSWGPAVLSQYCNKTMGWRTAQSEITKIRGMSGK